MKKALEGKVKDVRLSDRLKKSAACLNGDGGLSVEMYKVLKSMPNGGESADRQKTRSLAKQFDGSLVKRLARNHARKIPAQNR